MRRQSCDVAHVSIYILLEKFVLVFIEFVIIILSFIVLQAPAFFVCYLLVTEIWGGVLTSTASPGKGKAIAPKQFD